MRKKRILTEEHKRKIGNAARGKKHPPLSKESLVRIRKAAAKRKGIKTGPRSEEVKKKISKATKGVKKTITSPNKSWFPKGHKPNHSEETRKKISKSLTGRKPTLEQIEKTASKLRGRKASDEIKKKLSEVQLKRWECIPRKHDRRSVKNIEWSKKVIELCGNKCLTCGETKRLHSHHIITWEESEEYRYELWNGIALCPSCHNKEEWKYRSRPTNIGYKFTEEQKKRLSISHIGQKAWNKGKYTPPEKNRICRICGIEKDIEMFTPQGKYRTRMCKKCRNHSLRR